MTAWQAGRAAAVGRWAAGLALTSGLLVEPVAAAGADLARYRTHVLESSVADVVAASQARASEVVTVHERPARIQVLEWRTPYASVSDTDVDPVKGITFGFLEGRLYQMTVIYDRVRTVGLTTQDLVAGVSAVYGEQAPRASRPHGATGGVADGVVIGAWQDAKASVVLVRGPYDELQLILRSTELEPRAATAIAAALSQDAAEAPARRQDALAAEAAEAVAERARNKSRFRP
jgi:hypothetical protein